jgi:isoleucyl-tRNA synthetase
MTLYTALVTVVKLAAPMIPFMAEDIYRNLVCNIDKNAPISVHLCDYPVADEKLIDKDLEASMDEVLNIVVLGRAARNTANIKNRQPLGKIYATAAKALDKECCEIIEEELNLKAVEFTGDLSAFTS